MAMWRWIVLLLLLVSCTAAGAAGVQPSASVTTAVQGWEHWFRLEWTAQAKGDRREIDGYVYNSYGRAAAHMQMLAQALDASGNVVAQKIEWVPGTVPALNRAYFRIPGLPPAHAYRVSVWAFDFVDDARDRR